MATLHSAKDGKNIIYTKGAVEKSWISVADGMDNTGGKLR